MPRHIDFLSVGEEFGADASVGRESETALRVVKLGERGAERVREFPKTWPVHVETVIRSALADLCAKPGGAHMEQPRLDPRSNCGRG